MPVRRIEVRYRHHEVDISVAGRLLFDGRNLTGNMNIYPIELTRVCQDVLDGGVLRGLLGRCLTDLIPLTVRTVQSNAGLGSIQACCGDNDRYPRKLDSECKEAFHKYLLNSIADFKIRAVAVDRSCLSIERVKPPVFALT